MIVRALIGHAALLGVFLFDAWQMWDRPTWRNLIAFLRRQPLPVHAREDLLVIGAVMVASLAITPERSKQVQFSQPYAAATIVLYGKTGANIKSAADLKTVRVGVARASTQDVAVTKAAPEGTEIRRFDDDASAMQALISGQVDAIGCSVTVAAQIAKRVPANTFENKFNLLQQAMGIALRPGQDELTKAVNDFVARNTANGELNKLYQKWLGADLPKLQ